MPVDRTLPVLLHCLTRLLRTARTRTVRRTYPHPHGLPIHCGRIRGRTRHLTCLGGGLLRTTRFCIAVGSCCRAHLAAAALPAAGSLPSFLPLPPYGFLPRICRFPHWRFCTALCRFCCLRLYRGRYCLYATRTLPCPMLVACPLGYPALLYLAYVPAAAFTLPYAFL